MNKDTNTKVYRHETNGGQDNSLRRVMQNPRRTLSPYITENMTVLDLGCGSGFFAAEIAMMLGDSGKVIAADLHEGVLARFRQNLVGTDLEKKILLHKCLPDEIGLESKVDFILAFHMVGSSPDRAKLLDEIKELLNPNGLLFIIEPNLDVTKQEFEHMVAYIKSLGFETKDRPTVTFSRSIVFMKKA